MGTLKRNGDSFIQQTIRKVASPVEVSFSVNIVQGPNAAETSALYPLLVHLFSLSLLFFASLQFLCQMTVASKQFKRVIDKIGC